MLRPRPVWPASAAQAAGRPRLAGASGSLRRDLALAEASGAPAGRRLSHLVSDLGGGSARPPAAAVRGGHYGEASGRVGVPLVDRRGGRTNTNPNPNPNPNPSPNPNPDPNPNPNPNPNQAGRPHCSASGPSRAAPSRADPGPALGVRWSRST
eukprot:scaffold28427_cov48-Phaeocystis_antarctica.AAC.1